MNLPSVCTTTVYSMPFEEQTVVVHTAGSTTVPPNSYAHADLH